MSTSRAFRWEALAPGGDVRSGLMGAADRASVLRQLESEALFPIRVVDEVDRASSATSPSSDRDMASSLRVLGMLIESGLPLRRALEFFSELVPQSWGPLIGEARLDVEAGRPLSDALERAGVPIPALAFGFLRAGEETGTAGSAVLAAADVIDHRLEARAGVRRALAYPVTLAIAALASAAFISIVVIPRFATIVLDLGGELPLTTQIILGASAIVRAAVLPALVAGSLLGLYLRRTIGDPDGRERVHMVLLSLPVVGPLRKAAASQHFCTLTAHLLRSGIPFDRALRIAADASDDRVVARRLEGARRLLEEGLDIGEALARTAALDPVALRFARAGGESGSLPGALDHAARILSHQLSRKLESLTRAIEPTLIVGFGLVVGLIAAGLFQAIYGVQP